jgi:hypothetical protein
MFTRACHWSLSWIFKMVWQKWVSRFLVTIFLINNLGIVHCPSFSNHSVLETGTVLKSTVLRDVTLFSPVEVHQCFEGTQCFLLLDKRVSWASSRKKPQHYTFPVLFMLTTLRTTHLTVLCHLSGNCQVRNPIPLREIVPGPRPG